MKLNISNNTLHIILAVVVGIIIGYYSKNQAIENSGFNADSKLYLHGYKIDLPEEIADCKDVRDKFPGDYFLGVRDSVTKIITFSYFDPAEDFTPVKPRDYQLDCYNDSVILYDGNRRVGIAMWSDSSKYSPIEDLILEDNQ